MLIRLTSKQYKLLVYILNNAEVNINTREYLDKKDKDALKYINILKVIKEV